MVKSSIRPLILTAIPTDHHVLTKFTYMIGMGVDCRLTQDHLAGINTSKLRGFLAVDYLTRFSDYSIQSKSSSKGFEGFPKERPHGRDCTVEAFRHA